MKPTNVKAILTVEGRIDKAGHGLCSPCDEDTCHTNQLDRFAIGNINIEKLEGYDFFVGVWIFVFRQ